MNHKVTYQSDQAIQSVETARAALLAEAQAIRQAADRLNGNLSDAVKIILEHPGKVIVTGMGKSGHIAQKIAATLNSIGTHSVFLHPAEATHGDLGIYTPGDPTIMISKSGATSELVRLVPVLRQFQSPLIGILGNLHSPLAEKMDVVLDARVDQEADPLNLVPTCSSTVALALGDALAAALMKVYQFSDLDFARLHPNGQLGRNLLFRVANVMHTRQKIACVSLEDRVRQVVIAMTRYPFGAACVVDEQDHLLGIITDGDLRRALQTYEDLSPLHAADLMTAHPVLARPEMLLKDAVHLMEDRPSQISVLPVVGDDGKCVGLIRIHDIYQTDLT